MMTADINKLIGIPFKLGGFDFNGCDCRGICYLYHKYIHGIECPNSDGKRMFLRNVKEDIFRICSVLNTFCRNVDVDDSKEEGDFIIIETKEDIGALGVCVDERKFLYMTKKFGSCTARISTFKKYIIKTYRPFTHE